MKNIVLICLLVCSHLFVIAQKVEVKDGIIFNNEKQVAKIENTGSTLLPTYSITSITDEPLIIVDRNPESIQGKKLYVLTFEGIDEAIAYLDANINMQKLIAKEIVKYNLIENAELNEKAVLRFCKAKGGSAASTDDIDEVETKLDKKERLKEESQKIDEGARPKRPINYTIVDRNVNAPIVVAGGFITQEAKQIGKCNLNTGNVSGKAGKVFTVYAIDGKKVASVKWQNFAEEATMQTTKDGETQSIIISNANDVKVQEEIIKTLIEMGFL